MMAALGGICVHVANGGTRQSNRLKGPLAMAHGVGLLIVVIAGFGMLTQLRLGFPGWVWAKLVIWLVFGAAVALPYRKPGLAKPLLFLLPLLGGLAAYLGIYKPF